VNPDGYFAYGWQTCYSCAKTKDEKDYVDSNPDYWDGHRIYQIDLKGYKEQLLCKHDPRLPSLSSSSRQHCSLLCDQDEACTAFTFSGSRCIKRKESNTDDGNGDELRISCHVKNHRTFTMRTEQECKSACERTSLATYVLRAKLIKKEAYCSQDTRVQNGKGLSPGECAAAAMAQESCFGGMGYFSFRDGCGDCSCCIDSTANTSLFTRRRRYSHYKA